MAAVARLGQMHATGGIRDDGELRELIKSRSFRLGKFVLSSGRESDLYFNLKSTMMDPRGAHLSALAFLDHIDRQTTDFVGGLEMGAVPIIASLAAISDSLGIPVKTFFVRKEPKKHGTRDLIEGLAESESLGGKRVVIADDVATTGESIFKAIKAVREEGALVDRALVLVDREEGAKEFLANHGVTLDAVFRGSEFRLQL